MTPARETPCPTVIQVGVRGFGAVHLANIDRLAAAGRVRLVACVDPLVGSLGGDPGLGVPLFDSLTDALEAVGVPEVVIASVPIPLHAAVAAEALRAGADLLLEKPPFARLADLEALLALQRQTGRLVQVGFQALGSHALELIDRDEFGIGAVRHVRAMGHWVRHRAYWERTPWAGRRHLDGVDVMDGVATNPLAHAVATALRIAGLRRAEDVTEVVVDAYRTTAIDTDDTTALRIVPATGAEAPTVSAALTLSGPGEGEPPPLVEVVGEHGTLTLSYILDQVTGPDGAVRGTGRTDLLENLLAARATGVPLLAPLADTGAFMRVVEALRTAPEPTRIPERFIEVVGEGAAAHPVLQDVQHWIRAAADRDGTFAEAGAPWAFTGRDTVLAEAGAGRRGPLLTVQSGAGSVPDSAPRPFLHPVRTRAGVELTARRPADHDWHLGLGFTVPDAAGTNFWGGGSYRPGAGYQWLDDHGVQRLDALLQDPEELTMLLSWLDRDGEPVLRERRTMACLPIDGDCWELRLHTELEADRPIPLGSPGSSGRAGAGYGGWFWRLPACREITVRTPDGAGERAVNGSRAPWLAWHATFLGTPGATGPATIVLAPGDEQTAADPWFVRTGDYPGIGSAVAWERPALVEPGRRFIRSARAVIADGELDPADAMGRLAEAVPQPGSAL
ncbi:DUF6807 family protein [Enemella evansiae]|uniref:DUF6807 family protein n=1 Tax=Enemella evansiae TaxID=2016499 RepID=UPI00105C737A|nr:DUF6807 family protein [Enemella evansiae]TDO93289.1 putative dehydrogenase [Enemella evansiae]